MADPGDSCSPCPAAVAAATAAIVRRKRYRRGELELSVLSRESGARTVLEPHRTLPPIATAQPSDALRLSIFRGGAFEAARWLAESSAESPLVLDFASDSEPGGGWKGKQRGTQEEALCRESSLGVRLEEHYSAVGSGSYMPHMSLVYVPDVVVFRAAESAGYGLLQEPRHVAVVAGALRSTTPAEISNKVQGLLRLAASQGHRELVLGAWGCGAFGNDPHEVAAAMAKACRGAASCLDHVVFALPRRDEKLEAFIAAVPEAAVESPFVHCDPVRAGVNDWEVQAAVAELTALLPDALEETAARVTLSPMQLQRGDEAREAAQRFLHELMLQCLANLKGAVSEEVLLHLRRTLLEEAEADGAVRERFLDAARPLVREHFRSLSRKQRLSAAAR